MTFMANKRHHHKSNKRRRTRKRNFKLFGKSRRRNPVYRIKRHRRRRNPAGLGDLKQLTISASAAIAGGIATRAIPEAIVPAQNKGFLGYALNVGTAIIVGMAAGKFFGPSVGDAATLGGIVMTAGRVIQDQFDYKAVEFGSLPAGLLPSLSGDRAYRLAGDYVPANFPLPQSSLPGGRLALPAPVEAAAVVASLSRKRNGMAGGFGRSVWTN